METNVNQRDIDNWNPNGQIATSLGYFVADPSGAGVAAGEKAMSLSQLAWLSGEDVSASASIGGPRKAYSQSVWVYACISRIAANGGRVPIRLSRGPASGTRGAWGFKTVRSGRAAGRKVASTKSVHRAADGEIIEAGDLYQLLQKPNAEETFRDFIERTIIQLYIHGRVHWLFDDLVGRRPKSMYVIPASQSKPLVDESGLVPKLKGWEIRDPKGGRHPVLVDECITFQLFDPDDPYRGLSPRMPANLSIVSDYNASLFNAAMFNNSCEPGTVLETDAGFDAGADRQIRTSWQQRHSGPMNARKLAVLWGGLTHKSVSQTLKEMVYPQGKQLSREEVCAVFGVPASVAGFFGTTGDSSAYVDAELERFWQDTEGPLLDKFGDAINIHLCPLFDAGQEVWFDLEDVPVYQSLRRSRFASAKDMFSMGVSLADANELLDLGLPDRPWYAVGFLPMSIQPASQAAEGFPALPPVDEGIPDDPDGPDNPPEPPKEPEDPDKAKSAHSSIDKDAFDRIWRSWQQSYSPLAMQVRSILHNHYGAQERKLIARLKSELPEKANHSKKEGKATKDSLVIARVLIEVFNDEANRRFAARMVSPLDQTWRLGVAQSLDEAGIVGEAAETIIETLPNDPRISAAIRSDAVKLSGRVDAFTRNHLRESLANGMDAGESVKELADRIQSFMGNRRKAALGQARHAVAQTMSKARRQGRLTAGVSHEIWVHSRGAGQRRPGHVAAEATYRKEPKPVGKMFLIGGVMLRYPRDPEGPAKEVVHCQCVVIGKRLSDGEDAAKQFDLELTRLATRGFLPYEADAKRQTAEQEQGSETGNE